MEAQAVVDVFSPFGPVHLKRMFSGHGIYADEVIFGLEIRGEIFLKADTETQELFAAAGSLPFSYDRSGKTTSTSYWRMPEIAFDDVDELTRWCRLALDAARRASLRKSLGRKGAKPVKRPRAARRAGPMPAKSRKGPR